MYNLRPGDVLRTRSIRHDQPHLSLTYSASGKGSPKKVFVLALLGTEDYQEEGQLDLLQAFNRLGWYADGQIEKTAHGAEVLKELGVLPRLPGSRLRLEDEGTEAPAKPQKKVAARKKVSKVAKKVAKKAAPRKKVRT